MKRDPLAFRRQYEQEIIELTRCADIFSREFILTGEESHYRAYQRYVKKICDLKDYIVEVEKNEEEK